MGRDASGSELLAFVGDSAEHPGGLGAAAGPQVAGVPGRPAAADPAARESGVPSGAHSEQATAAVRLLVSHAIALDLRKRGSSLTAADLQALRAAGAPRSTRPIWCGCRTCAASGLDAHHYSCGRAPPDSFQAAGRLARRRPAGASVGERGRRPHWTATGRG